MCLSAIVFISEREEGIGRENKEEGGERKERERNIDGPPPTITLTRDPFHNLGMCPDWKLNWLPFSVRDDAQLTEQHWPGQLYLNMYNRFLVGSIVESCF